MLNFNNKKMKILNIKINKIGLCVLTSLLLTLGSCSDFLVENPKGFLSPTTFFNSEKNIEIALNGVYDGLGNRGMGSNVVFGNYNHGLLSMGEVGTDQMQANNDDGSNRFSQLDVFAITSSSELPTDVWRAHYIAINRANTLISRVEPLLGNSAFDQVKLKRYIAEAKFLRAFFYFNLVRFYGAVPLKITETQSLTASDVVGIERSPVLAVYQQIESDLLAAQDDLVLPSQLLATQYGRATKTAAWALLARVYTTWASYPLKDASKWALAASNAKKVMDSNEHTLLADFPSIFKKEFEGNKELIFVVKFSTAVGESSANGGHNGVIGTAGANAFSPGLMTGFGTVRLESSFYDSYSANDQRRDWTCSAFLQKGDGTTIPLTTAQKTLNIGMAKFRRDGSYISYGCPYDYPLIRYADVLTMHAEASAMANGSPTVESYAALNQVRRRAFKKPIAIADATVDYAGLSQTNFKAAVLQERSWELVSEDCSRWHDLVRTEQLGVVIRAKKRPAALVRFNENTHKLFPIPLFEIDANPLIPVSQQNPGY